jgi:ATP-dependent DNA helicase RecG
MAKTGVVERSGQGIDKIFYQTLTEAKPAPDYTKSDDYQVELRLSAIVEDKAFSLFIHQIQEERRESEKLSVQEVVILNKIRKEVDKSFLDSKLLDKLEKEGLIEKHGKTKGVFYSLSRSYFEFTGEKGKYSKLIDWDENQIFYIILQHLQKFSKAKMSDFTELFKGGLNQRQIKYSIDKLVEKKDLQREGEKSGTTYSVGENFKNTMELLSKAIDIGIKQMRDKGEIE